MLHFLSRWCVFEAAAASEVVSRSTRYDEGQRALAAIEIAKIYALDGMQAPQRVELRGSQDRATVEASIRAAKFTNGSDEERVVKLYNGYMARVFEAFNDAQHAGVAQVLRTRAKKNAHRTRSDASAAHTPIAPTASRRCWRYQGRWCSLLHAWPIQQQASRP